MCVITIRRVGFCQHLMGRSQGCCKHPMVHRAGPPHSKELSEVSIMLKFLYYLIVAGGAATGGFISPNEMSGWQQHPTTSGQWDAPLCFLINTEPKYADQSNLIVPFTTLGSFIHRNPYNRILSNTYLLNQWIKKQKFHHTGFKVHFL